MDVPTRPPAAGPFLVPVISTGHRAAPQPCLTYLLVSGAAAIIHAASSSPGQTDATEEQCMIRRDWKHWATPKEFSFVADTDTTQETEETNSSHRPSTKEVSLPNTKAITAHPETDRETDK
ncbi:hypothetical protein J6590_075600 [Homalodisca vitripennis]|nr:hypothetical protein J6590_075600 [Homalodisca vitripennis]